LRLRESVNRYLQSVNAHAGSSAFYVLDLNGTAIASSNWDEEVSFVGMDLSYRPYFQEALRKGSGRFYGIGTTSGIPGYYFSHGIHDDESLLGVAALKVSLDGLERSWQAAPEIFLVLDENGVVFLSSVPEWKFKSFGALSPTATDKIQVTRQHDRVNLKPLDVIEHESLGADARIISLRTSRPRAHRAMGPSISRRAEGLDSDWRLTLLSDLEPVATARQYAAVGAALAFAFLLLLVLYLSQRQRAITESLASKEALQRAHDELERKVSERTADLTAANINLQREIAERMRAEVILPGAERTVELYDAGFDAFWEIDFFGRVRRLIEASEAEAQSFEATRRDVAVTLIGEVARNYLELRGAQQRLEVARANAVNQEQTLKLTNILLDGGRGTAFDVARAEAQFNTTLATMPPLEAQIKRSLHTLAVLTGRPPGAVNGELASVAPIPALAHTIGIETPGELLRRRPDIRAAERRLAAFTAGIGVAVADLFPRVTLIGTAGVTATSGSNLVRDDAAFYSIGPSIIWLAAFDIGRVRARIDQAEARADQAFAQYERTVLAALEEVESALVTFGRERVRYANLRQSELASTEAAELARLRFREGVATFLEVLDAERVQLAAQDELVVSETRVATALAAVYKALGGGWEFAPVDQGQPQFSTR
jgi:multidrug efflux system outer membrane protein